VRMPDGRVGVVDGCGEPPAASDRGSPLFSLIEDLGEQRLLFACVTHPHQDHFGGFVRLIRKHPPEHLWWSGTRERKFFEHYRAWLKRRGSDVPVGEDEPPGIGLERLVKAINDVAEADGAPTRPRVQHLEDHKVLWSHQTAAGTVVIEGVLPSSSGVRAAERDALRMLEGPGIDDAKRIFDPNRISGALRIAWGKTRVLLGGDALVEGDPHAGWEGVPNPIGRVHFVEVPHHASHGAYSERLWQEMKPELAVVTCVKNAKNDQPPRPEMLARLLRGGATLAVTSQPAWWTEERHLLAEQPSWAGPAAPKAERREVDPGNPALAGKARPQPATNKHENAVVVSLDDHGAIVDVQLHGAARQLRLR